MDTALFWPVVVPLIAGVVALLAPLGDRAVRLLAFVALLVPLAFGLGMHIEAFTAPSAALRHRVEVDLALGVGLRLGADGISAAMLLLSGVIGVVAVVASRGIAQRVRAYHGLLLLLFAGVNGVFVCLDAVLFYVAWELMLIPMFLLIAIWGGAQRQYAALKFAVFTIGGSVLMLLAILGLWAAVPAAGVTVAVPPHTVLAQIDTGAAAPPRLADAAGNAVLALHGLALQHDGRPVRLTDADGAARPFTPEHRIDAALARELFQRGRSGPYWHVEGRPLAEAGAWLERQPLTVHVPRDFDLTHWTLLHGHFAATTLFGLPVAALAFWLLFIAFAVKIPAMPFHTWLPHAHVQAPTAISVVLAGILLKLGVFGLLRVAWPICPQAALAGAPFIGALGAGAMLLGALIALAQTDFKRLVAYASVSHMGACLLGLATLTDAGVQAAAVQAFNHGTGSALLFLCVGVVYDRLHHRRLDGMGGLNAPMPRYGAVLLLAALCGAGLPGLSGFPGELLALLGAFGRGGVFTVYGVAAALTVIVSAAYLLWMAKRVLYGPVRAEHAALPDLNRTEVAAMAPLVALILTAGVAPLLVSQAVAPACQALVRHVLGAAP
jgi:NADH-quinone oxidoreductase subunit M